MRYIKINKGNERNMASSALIKVFAMEFNKNERLNKPVQIKIY